MAKKTEATRDIHAKLIDQVEDFLLTTMDGRARSELARDYVDNKQWTDEELAKLRARKQAAVTINRCKPKVEGLKGLLVQRKTDPKAFPRTKKHEKAADAVTDGLRYVADHTDYDTKKLEVAENIFVEGTGACIIEMEDGPKGPEIAINKIDWDRYFYDCHSRQKDFSDKRYDGIIMWMDVEDTVDMFDLSEDDEESLLDVEAFEYEDDTFADRPQWADKKNRRVRVVEHFFKDHGTWKVAYYTRTRMLVEPVDSPYHDEYGQPVNPIVSQSANIDRDNNRFGEVEYWLDLQREINHRRSKFLYLLSARQTAAPRGAIDDIPALKRALADPQGHIEYNGDKGVFEILKTNDMSEAQFTLLQDAKQEIDSVGFNAQLSGERQGDLSGKAINSLQLAGMNELAPLFELLAKLDKRVFRQVWYRIRQFWNEERWMSITDNSAEMRWVGFNTPVTLQELLEEQINDDSLPVQTRSESAALYQKLMAQQDPRLQETHEIRNNPAELDMDIMIALTPDVINVQQEQFEMLSKLAQTRPEIPLATILKLSSLRGKDEVLKEMKAASEATAQAQAIEQDANVKETQSKTVLNDAKAKKETAAAMQTMVQTTLIEQNPPKDPAVIL